MTIATQENRTKAEPSYAERWNRGPSATRSFFAGVSGANYRFCA
jgi:hypothetical protein